MSAANVVALPFRIGENNISFQSTESLKKRAARGY